MKAGKHVISCVDRNTVDGFIDGEHGMWVSEAGEVCGDGRKGG